MLRYTSILLHCIQCTESVHTNASKLGSPGNFKGKNARMDPAHAETASPEVSKVMHIVLQQANPSRRKPSFRCLSEAERFLCALPQSFSVRKIYETGSTASPG